MGFEAKHVLLEEGINLCVSIDLSTHFFDFYSDRGVEIVLEFAAFFNVGGVSLDLSFYFSEPLEMLICRGNDSFRYDLNQALSNAFVLS